VILSSGVGIRLVSRMTFTGIGDALCIIVCRCWNRCVYWGGLERRRPRGITVSISSAPFWMACCASL
jgi:hypothetical protein